MHARLLIAALSLAFAAAGCTGRVGHRYETTATVYAMDAAGSMYLVQGKVQRIDRETRTVVAVPTLILKQAQTGDVTVASGDPKRESLTLAATAPSAASSMTAVISTTVTKDGRVYADQLTVPVLPYEAYKAEQDAAMARQSVEEPASAAN